MIFGGLIDEPEAVIRLCRSRPESPETGYLVEVLSYDCSSFVRQPEDSVF
jgi:hypothetical protein